MNFLAHFYLSGNDENIIVGNFLGDFVKGRKYLDYPQKIQKGILLHRYIDFFTDKHPATKSAVKFLQPRFYKYSPVILDVFFDYCFAIQWNKYSKANLLSFSEYIYSILEKYSNLFDIKQKEAFLHMQQHNWLYNYSKKAGIIHSLNGLSRRAKFENNISDAPEILFENTNFFIKEFNAVFADIVPYVSGLMKKNA